MTFTCPRTHRRFNAEPLEVQELDGFWFVQVRCVWCDVERRWWNEPGYDKDRPQVHTIKLKEKPE